MKYRTKPQRQKAKG